MRMIYSEIYHYYMLETRLSYLILSYLKNKILCWYRPNRSLKYSNTIFGFNNLNIISNIYLSGYNGYILDLLTTFH